jgi:CheY-like chemotaxis protein
MNFYANLKIGNKLIIGFSAVVLMTFTIGLFGYVQIHILDKADHVLFDKGVKPLAHIGAIAADFQRLRSNLRELILVKEQRDEEFFAGRVTKFHDEIDAGVKKLEEELPTAESRQLFAKLVQARNEFFPVTNRVMALSKLNKDNEALEYLKSSAVMAVEKAEIDAIEALEEYLVANAAKIAEQNTETATTTGRVMLTLAFGASLLAAFMAALITRSVTSPLRQVLDAVRLQQEGGKQRARLVEAIAGGDLNQDVTVVEPIKIENEQLRSDEAGTLLKAMVEMSKIQYSVDQGFARMTESLRHSRAQETEYREQQTRYREEETLRDWFKSGQNDLNTVLRGEKTTAELTQQTLLFLAEYVGAGVGVFYTFDDRESSLQIAASYAFTRRKRLNERIALGEGLAGQAALERKMICLNQAPPDYLPISSALGEADPINIVVLPLLRNDALTGVLELGSFKIFSDNELQFLNQSMEGIAIALSVNKSRQQVNELLEETQTQSEELRVQQEELQQSNEELEERAQTLEQQREQIRAKNREVEEASRDVQRKAEELERISTYKSEFLSNMSHELRTPLNSLMILSSMLKDNAEGNLTDKQVEFAATINGAGRDLLTLINDILDLSKIESGHMEFHYEEASLPEICHQIETLFQPITSNKGIEFSVTLDESAPKTVIVDDQRTQQILKNLLSNACKFTRQGSVTLRAYTPVGEENILGVPAVAFAVADTGIGIPPDKQTIVFNAFEQADGSISRTYGGTGLGLSISRQLARSMGGEIALASEAGQGSTFTLYLPLKGSNQPSQPIQIVHARQRPKEVDSTPAEKILDPLPAPIPDDRDRIQKGAKSILVIEDDLTFAGILAEMVRGRGFSVLVAAEGESGIKLAERHQPSAIILDVMLPNIDGWGVMRSLKDSPKTRHIPVHFLTCLEDRQKAMNMGAIGFVTKPVSREQLDSVFSTLEATIDKTMKKLLIVEDDPAQIKAMVALLEARDVTITVADKGAKAIQLLSGEKFDCIVLDLGLEDMGAFELLEELKKVAPDHCTPVIIHTGRELTSEDTTRLHHYANSVIIKGAKSPERLLNEVTLFLHQVETSLPPDKQRMIRAALDKEAMLEGKKILIVDDDMRNIFSLTSALEKKKIVVFEAENGNEALKRLEEHPDIDLVLMDIMMPGMNGYEASRAIRSDARFRTLPIIALTAKAMKGDREECLKAGASDYIPKPVDLDKLFSLLRVWLYSSSAPDSLDME